MIHDTESFFIVEEAEGHVLEIWYDWMPRIDDAPSSPIVARRVDADLLLDISHSDGSVVVRKFADLQQDVWQDIEKLGVCFVICGPSGVLAKKTTPLQLQ